MLATAYSLQPSAPLLFQNNGSKAGQHEPHFHVHVVPRYAASDPNRRFLQRDYTIVSIEEQRAIAQTIKAALAG